MGVPVSPWGGGCALGVLQLGWGYLGNGYALDAFMGFIFKFPAMELLRDALAQPGFLI